MAGQQILDLLIGVRVPAGQPFDSSVLSCLMQSQCGEVDSD